MGTIKRLLYACYIILIFTFPAYANCYTASQIVGYSGNFHDDTGTLYDPTSPAATVRITPFTGTATYTALTAPAKLNTVTGWYGGEYTVPASPTYGTYEIRISGTVPTAKNVSKVATIFQVLAQCPTSILTATDDLGPTNQKLSNIKTDTSAILADTGTDGVVVAIGSKSGYSLAADQSTVTIGTTTTVTNGVTLANDAITAAKIAAGAIGLSEIGDTAGTVTTGSCTASVTLFDTDKTEAGVDHWKDSFLTFTNTTTTVELRGQTKAITASAINGCITVKSPGFTTIPQSGDTFVIINK